MKTLFAFLALLCVASVFADVPAKITDLKAAMKTAKSQGKLLFIQMGRERCEHCQALKNMIASRQVQLPASQYVYADVDCDDMSTKDLFVKHFTIDGNELPFVIVAAPDGTQLAARSGEGSAKDYAGLLRDAQKVEARKAAKK